MTLLLFLFLVTVRAFLDPYAKYQLFSDGAGGLNMDEFIDAREVVASLSAEYEACEHPEYVSCKVVGAGGGKWGLALRRQLLSTHQRLVLWTSCDLVPVPC